MPLQRKLHTGKNEKNVNYILLHQVALLKYLKEVYRRLLAVDKFEHTWSNTLTY